MYGSMLFYIGYLSIHEFGYPQESLNKISTDIERQLSFEESNIMRIFDYTWGQCRSCMFKGQTVHSQFCNHYHYLLSHLSVCFSSP